MSSRDDAAWDEYVRNHPRGTIFHLSGWSRAVETALGHRSYALKCERNGVIAGVLPLISINSILFGRALISNAFAVAGGPLGVDDAAERELMKRATDLSREVGTGYIELKDTTVAADGWIAKSDLYYGFQRDIAADEDACLTQIPRKQRAVVRKALESSLRETIDETIDDFFALYSRTVRDHGTPVFPRRLFQAFKKTFGDACEVLTVRRGETPISSVMSFYYGNSVLPYYTGSVPEARAVGSNDFMYWRLMRRASERGATIFDFGRSKVGTGPFAFKKNWGFSPRPITHQYFLNKRKTAPNINPTNPKFDLMVRMWKQLPLPIANRLGPLISRDLG